MLLELASEDPIGELAALISIEGLRGAISSDGLNAHLFHQDGDVFSTDILSIRPEIGL